MGSEMFCFVEYWNVDFKFHIVLFENFQDLIWPNEFKERAFLAIADLIMLSMFLSVSPQVREAAMVRGDSKDQTTLNVCKSKLNRTV